MHQFHSVDTGFIDDFVSALVGMHFNIGCSECGCSLRKERFDNALMHEEFFSGVADADTLRFCIEDDGDGFVLVAGLVDVDVYVASSGFNDRHFGVLHDGLNKSRSPSWNEQVDVTLGLHHGGGALASVFVDGCDECGVISVFA